ncbi:IucA/IucC family C-terminal-domain containing protein [Actinomycetota bacterium Odt1-20B]
MTTRDPLPGLTASDLAEVASVGGFFALRAAPLTEGAGAVPLAAAYASGPSPRTGADRDPLTFRVTKVASRLGAPEARIAVSVAQLGLAARLWSVALGCAALHGRVPDLSPEHLHWDPDATSPDDLWLPPDTPTHAADAAHLHEAVQHAHLEPLSAALRARHHISPRLLWGNAGSALAGAVRELDGWARRVGRPEVSARAEELATELFTHPDLHPTGTRTATAFRRRSCCLYYRCPGGGLCGDCCFDRPPRRPTPSAPA